MFHRLVCAVCAALFVGVAEAADEPQWLKEARAREARSTPATEIKSKDGWFKARVPGKVAHVIEEEEGSYSVQIDIGTDAPIQCEVYPKGIDMAGLLRHTLLATMVDVAETQGKVEARNIESIDAGAHGNAPYISTSWIYRVATDEGALLGGFKQFVMEKDQYNAYCAHLDLGYARTFAEVTKAFATSIATKTAEPAPYYLEIATASMNGSKVGVAIISLQRDAEGDTKARQVTSMLIPAAAHDVHSQDASHIEWVGPDAALINASHAISSNGELATDIALVKQDDVWTIKGTLQGKEVQQKLEGKEPGSWVAQARDLRKLMASGTAGAEHRIPMWVSADPGKLTEVKTKLGTKLNAGSFSGVATVGGLTAKLTLDAANGMASAMEMQVGPQIVKVERVYHKGTL